MKAKKEERIKAAKEKLDQKKEVRCSRFKEKLGTKITNISERKDKHLAVYSGIISKVEALIVKLDEKGLDTSELGADLKTFQEKVEKFKGDFTALSDKISTTEGSACSDEEDGKIKLNLGGTRTLVQALQKDSKEIRSFYQTEIRTDIQALRKQASKIKSENQPKEAAE